MLKGTGGRNENLRGMAILKKVFNRYHLGWRVCERWKVMKEGEEVEPAMETDKIVKYLLNDEISFNCISRLTYQQMGSVSDWKTYGAFLPWGKENKEVGTEMWLEYWRLNWERYREVRSMYCKKRKDVQRNTELMNELEYKRRTEG